MYKHKCQTKHDPANGSYGDCLRACIASLLHIENPLDVPNFADGNASGDEMWNGLRAYLRGRQLDVMHVSFTASFAEIRQTMAVLNPGTYYMVIGQIDGGGHIIICKDDKIEHNPAWYPTGFDGPLPGGFYDVVLLIPAFMRENG